MISKTRLQRVSTWIDQINALLCKAISWLTLFMALTTFAIVVLRYGFNLGWIALQESVMYMHAAVFLLGAAYTLQSDGHVRVDVFYRRFSESQKAWVNIIGTLVFLLPVSVFILAVSWQYVLESWQLLEKSKEAGGLPFLYILKSFIPLFALTMIMQGIADIIKHGLSLVDVAEDTWN